MVNLCDTCVHIYKYYAGNQSGKRSLQLIKYQGLLNN